MHVKKIPGMRFDSNIYIIRDDGNSETAIVDAGTGFNFHYVTGEIERADGISAIILTHEHFDHCGGAPGLKKLYGAEVMIHEAGAETLEKGLDWSASLFGAEQPVMEVDRKLKDGDIVMLGEEHLHVIYTPGHSPGSICLYNPEDKSLFSGDTIFSDGGIGRTDFFGGDIKKLASSIKKIYDMVSHLNTLNLYPGHGPHVIGGGVKHVEMALRTASAYS